MNKMKFKKIISAIFLVLIMVSVIFPISVSAETTYAQIPKFYLYTESQTAELLKNAGIKYKVTYEENTNPDGTVFKFVYYGYSDKENYFVNTEKEATLYVSGKAPEPVVLQNAVQSENSNVIYLTFDDGPYKERTQTVLDLLKKYEIKATFFLVGKSAETYPELVKNIYNDGHTIACHTYSHDFKYVYSSTEAFEWEISKWESVIHNILGTDLPYKIFRYPGGSNNSYLSKSLAPAILTKLTSLGYTAYDWTLANNDAWTVQKKSYQTMDDFLKWSLQTTLETREKTPTVPKVVLMHDTNQATVDMLEWAIQYLIEKGYTFETLDTLSDGWLF